MKPDVAQAAHAAAIQATVDGAIAAAGISPDQLSAVAVTIGPGLSLCLQVGLTPGAGGGVLGGVEGGELYEREVGVLRDEVGACCRGDQCLEGSI